MTKKTMLKAAVVLGFSAAYTLTAYAAGWTQNGDKYSYQFESNAWARDQLVEIDGQKYGFDAQGYMMTGWQKLDGNYYYFEASGAAATGWKQLNEVWYYLNPTTSVMQTGWLKEGTKLYYFDENGAMQTGIFYTGGFAYQAEADGSVIHDKDERSEATGNRFIYESDGKIKFASTLTEASNKAGGGDVYEYLTTPEQMRRWESEQRDNVQQAIEEKEDELYEEYKKDVLNTSKQKARSDRLEKWENKVNRKLTELGVSQQEINDYIYNVKTGSYGDGDNSYYYSSDDYDYDY